MVAIRVLVACVVARVATADAVMLTVGVAVRVIAATVAMEEDQGRVTVLIRVLVALVVASMGTADIMSLTVGKAVRINAAAVAAALPANQHIT
jgi:hypothetical protein